MEKLRFEFVVKQSEDPKTNVICITSITDTDKNMYLIPDKFQPAKLHEEIIKTQTFQKVKCTLQKRHERRHVWISLTQDLRNSYMDGDGNMQFKGYLLEQITSQTEQQTSAEALSRVLENFTELKKQSKQPNLKELCEKFVIEKFTKKTSSVTQWMVIFEAECTRIGIDEDIQKIQVFRLFLDDSCQDWYNSMLIKYTVNSEWCIWKKNFCETYVNIGWTPIRYAFSFKYRQGSLLEYALKKERLLLEINKSIDKHTLIDLIVTGLPNFVADEIDRNNLQETEDLFSSIRGLEYLINRRIVWTRDIDSGSKIKEKSLKDRPCRICEKEKKGTRYHPESVCWFKNRDSDRLKKEPIRSVNNSELEMSLNEIDPKN
ncbi:uncharacterized protein LOC106709891 [Papilio machaon]|uniref:uncharacterized protein LOC106709891 n=1 Tax=Papilio machaon TaxID=76193 RepID=UPI0006EAFBA7|nr:uncharacterized protein LOC106709891 [Papilio machaon]